MATAADHGRNLCVFAHGMGGDLHDWDTWVEVLSSRFPSWTLEPLARLARPSRFLGAGLDALAELAAEEILEAIRATGLPLTLHCVGHSMGGLVLRGALPRLVEELKGQGLELGHYLSLSTPHLGIQATWRAPLQLWRNLCWLSSFVTPQLAQLAIQDSGCYLAELSTGAPAEALSRFRRRTCVSLASADPLIPVSSGVIDPSPSLSPHSFFSSAFWRFEGRSGMDSASHFERKWSDARAWAHFGGQWPFLGKWLGLGRAAQDLQPIPTKLGHSEECRCLDDFIGSAKAQSSTWLSSDDGCCTFPSKILEGLGSMPWQRIVARMHHPPMARNAHVFLIGKRCEQFSAEHRMSRQCIECLAEVLAD